MKKALGFILLAFLLQGCSTIDDFFTGTDNAITPTPLEDISAQVSVFSEWSQYITFNFHTNRFKN